MKKWTTYELALIALLASFIAITGAIKIPICTIYENETEHGRRANS